MRELKIRRFITRLNLVLVKQASRTQVYIVNKRLRCITLSIVIALRFCTKTISKCVQSALGEIKFIQSEAKTIT